MWRWWLSVAAAVTVPVLFFVAIVVEPFGARFTVVLDDYRSLTRFPGHLS